MQTKLEWQHGSPTGVTYPGDVERWHVNDGKLCLHVWRCPAGWWISAMVVPDQWGDGGWRLLYEDSLLGPHGDNVEAMVRCERRARDVVMAHFGNLLIPASGDGRGAKSEK